MMTAKADERKRLVVPLAHPGQVYDIQGNADGSIALSPVKVERREPFPEGSLKRYAAERDEEFESFIAKTVVGLPRE